MEEYSKQDPMQPRMADAREATFGTRWPHEGKKGWQCQTKKVGLFSETERAKLAAMLTPSIAGGIRLGIYPDG